MRAEASISEEVIAALDALDCDGERAHIEADELLLDALRIHNESEIIAAYEAARSRICFWYA